MKIAGCDGKQKHTKREADKVAKDMKSRGRKRVSVYKCTTCRNYHIGENFL